MSFDRLTLLSHTKISSRIFIYIFFLVVLVLKLITVNFLSLDSDETMWSYMVYTTLNFGKNYVYFTTQNFRGSIEAYMLLPFQLAFGYYLTVLRVNSIIFSLLSSFLVYKNLKLILAFLKNNLQTLFSLLGVVFYNLLTYENYVIQTKAWGNYIFIQFAMLLCFYLINVDLFKYKKGYVSIGKLVLIGILIGVSFWANMQSLYFSLVILTTLLFINIISFLKQGYFKDHKIGDLFLNNFAINFIVFVNFLASIFNLYFILNKRLIFNPALTLNLKLGLNLPQHVIDSLNISLLYFVYVMWGLLLISLFGIYIKLKNTPLTKILLPFNLLTGLLFLGISVNIYHNSFNRISAQGSTVVENYQFLHKIIFTSFLGDYYLFYVGLILVFSFYRLYSFLFKKRFVVEPIDIFIFSVFAFVLMFLFSSIPQLTPTPRYLIIWWPIAVVTLTYIFSLVGVHVYNKTNKPILGFALVFLMFLPLMLSVYNDVPVYKNSYKTRIDQKVSNHFVIDTILNKNYGYCVGDYYKIGVIMFYSKFKIKCYTDEKYGLNVSYTNFFKDKYVNQKVYIVK